MQTFDIQPHAWNYDVILTGKKMGKKCVNVNLQHIAYINWIQMGTQELCILVVMVTTLHYYYGKSRHVTIPAGDWMGTGI